MKRYLLNVVAFLLIIAVGFTASRFYAPAESPIRGATNLQRAQAIAERVDTTYEYVAVTDGSLGSLSDGSGYVRYVMTLVFPNAWLEAAQNPSQLSVGIQQNLIKAVGEYKDALRDLARLSVRYLAPNDPILRTIFVEIRFPDGTLVLARGSLEQFAAIAPDAETDAWFEKFTFEMLEVSIASSSSASSSEASPPSPSS
jgi:hypothetical protein